MLYPHHHSSYSGAGRAPQSHSYLCAWGRSVLLNACNLDELGPMCARDLLLVLPSGARHRFILFNNVAKRQISEPQCIYMDQTI